MKEQRIRSLLLETLVCLLDDESVQLADFTGRDIFESMVRYRTDEWKGESNTRDTNQLVTRCLSSLMAGGLIEGGSTGTYTMTREQIYNYRKRNMIGINKYQLQLALGEAIMYLQFDPDAEVDEVTDFTVKQIHAAMFKCRAKERLTWERPSGFADSMVSQALTAMGEEGRVNIKWHGTEPLCSFDNDQVQYHERAVFEDVGLSLNRLKRALVSSLYWAYDLEMKPVRKQGYDGGQVLHALISSGSASTILGWSASDCRKYAYLVGDALRVLRIDGKITATAADGMLWSMTKPQRKRYKALLRMLQPNNIEGTNMIQLSKLKDALCSTIYLLMAEAKEGDEIGFTKEQVYNGFFSTGVNTRINIVDGSDDFKELVGSTLDELVDERLVTRLNESVARYYLTDEQSGMSEQGYEAASLARNVKKSMRLIDGDIGAVKDLVEDMNIGDLMAFHQFVSNVVNRKVTKMVALHEDMGATVAKLQKTLDGISADASTLTEH